MNPYDLMRRDLIIEAEEEIMDEYDEDIISIFSNGESEQCCEDDEEIDDIVDAEDDE